MRETTMVAVPIISAKFAWYERSISILASQAPSNDCTVRSSHWQHESLMVPLIARILEYEQSCSDAGLALSHAGFT